MKEITIYEYQLKDIVDVLRLIGNIYKVRDANTCFGRDFRQAEQFAKNALDGNKDKKVKRI